jgi:hypothetical protein
VSKFHVVNTSNLNRILNKDFRTQPTMLYLPSTYVSITGVGLFHLNTVQSLDKLNANPMMANAEAETCS